MRRMGFLVRNIHQSWVVVWLGVGVIFGVVLGLILRVNYLASPWFLVASLAMVGFLLVRPVYLLMGLALLSGLMMSFVRVAGELDGENFVQGLVGTTVVVTGEISGDPNADEDGTKFKLTNLRFGKGCGKASTGEESSVVGCQLSAGSLYISGGKNEKLKRGDTVTLGGTLESGFGTYVGFMYRPEVRRHLKPEPGNLVVMVRNWFAERVERLIQESESKLGLSYLLGMKTGLSDELSQQLRVVGLTHIVVASGAHLSILVEVARKIFGRVSRFAGVLFAGIFVLFFMAMVGWTPSIMRAGAMAILTLGAWYVGRKIAAWRIILMVAAGTLLVNPMFVIDLGWLLSFASYAGIMIIGPKMQKFFYGAKKPGFVGGMAITTVAATVMTLPVTLYFFGQISLISVAANLLILPTLPVAMGLVFLTGVVSGVSVVETVVAWCAERLLDFHIVVVGWFGEMKQFLVVMEPYQVWVFGGYLVILGVLAVRHFCHKQSNKKATIHLMSS